METRQLYSIDEAMQLLGGISRETIYGLLRNGKLASVEFGRRRFISQQAITQFVESNTTQKMHSLLDRPPAMGGPGSAKVGAAAILALRRRSTQRE